MSSFEPFAPDILTLISKGVDLYRYLQSRSTRAIARGQEGSRTVKALYEFLRTLYYDIDVLVGPDGAFPIGLLEVAPEVAADPEQILGSLSLQKPPRAINEPEVMDAIKRRGSALWNGNTFSLDSIELDDQGRARRWNAFIGSYFDMVNSAVYLEYETLTAVAQSLGGRPYGLDALPKRQAALSSFDTPSDCLRLGGAVDATMAISTLTVFRRDDRYWMLCEVRSSNVAEYGDLYHVAPSFIFQPVTPLTKCNLEIEWGIRHNIFREYLEEIFNVPEVAHTPSVLSADYFYGHPNLKLLQRMLADGRAEMWAVAVAFNLLNHRPELCTVLVIQDPDWYEAQKDVFSVDRYGLQAHLNFNDEFRPSEHDDVGVNFESVRTLPMDDPQWRKIIRPWSTVPPAAPALVLGVRSVCDRLGVEPPNWLSSFSVSRGSPVPFGLD